MLIFELLKRLQGVQVKEQLCNFLVFSVFCNLAVNFYSVYQLMSDHETLIGEKGNLCTSFMCITPPKSETHRVILTEEVNLVGKKEMQESKL